MRAVVTAALFVLLSATAQAQIRPKVDPDAPTVITRPERSKVQLGEPFKIFIVVIHKPDMKVNLPTKLALGDGFSESGDRLETSAREPDGLIKHTFALDVVALEVGAVTFPSVAVGYEVAGEHRQLMSEPVTLEVASVVGKGSEELRPLAPPVAVLERDLTVLWVAGGVLVGGGLSFAAFLLLRGARRRRVAVRAASGVVRILPADEAALERLRQILASGRLDGEDRRPVYFEMTEIVREYLGKRFDFDALELTSREVVEVMGRKGDAGTVTRLGEWLDECDLIKYARVQPGRDLAEAAVKAAIELVEATRVVPAPAPAPAPASASAPAGGGA